MDIHYLCCAITVGGTQRFSKSTSMAAIGTLTHVRFDLDWADSDGSLGLLNTSSNGETKLTIMLDTR